MFVVFVVFDVVVSVLVLILVLVVFTVRSQRSLMMGMLPVAWAHPACSVVVFVFFMRALLSVTPEGFQFVNVIVVVVVLVVVVVVVSAVVVVFLVVVVLVVIIVGVALFSEELAATDLGINPLERRICCVRRTPLPQ